MQKLRHLFILQGYRNEFLENQKLFTVNVQSSSLPPTLPYHAAHLKYRNTVKMFTQV